MEEKIGNVVMDYTYYSGSDLYSDGDIEDEILDIAKNYDEDEFGRIIAETKNWAIMYHLSKMRANILEWIPMNKNQAALEIGSGCGAVTGTLASKVKNVTCIDLSKKRSSINAYRNKKKDNITIKIGNFEDVEKGLNEKYDVITLIGVFEYGAAYISSKNPYEEFLKIIMRHLKDDGRIIMAIENKLGLKYFAGCQEDHFGGYFTGIENYQGRDGVRTFTKKGLEKIFEKVGLKETEFFYPYPDYKFPNTIYSDEYLPKKGELIDNYRNFDRARFEFFNEANAYSTIIEDGLFPLFSNSYLVIAKKGGSL